MFFCSSVKKQSEYTKIVLLSKIKNKYYVKKLEYN